MEQMLSDPRRRRLGILSVIAVLLVVFAAFALWQQSEEVAPRYQPSPMFPGLAEQARDVARVHVAAKSGSFDVAFKPNKGWVVASRNDLPASFDRVNRTVVGVASLQILEPRTARADWLHYLDLEAPPKGSGVLITFMDAKGGTLASVIAGKSQDLGDQSGAGGIFVRKPDSTQSWLAKGTLDVKSDVSDWYDKNLLSVDTVRIAETDVSPAGSPAYSVKRDKAKDPFKFVSIPAGREISDAATAEGVGTGIAGLNFLDAKPAKGFDFSKAGRVVTRTFDGLTVTLQVVQQGPDYWMTVSAQGAGSKTAQEAQNINAKTSGWAYKLAPFKAQQLTAKMEVLLKPLATAKAKTATPTPDSDSDE